jgi:hypothetical protein
MTSSCCCSEPSLCRIALWRQSVRRGNESMPAPRSDPPDQGTIERKDVEKANLLMAPLLCAGSPVPIATTVSASSSSRSSQRFNSVAKLPRYVR